ncbi:glutathione S-transferase family protein [Paraferrimonas sp. SM1919]|uniref:glutathione S-transferase family protein n=1 Tax=Paraferrimonas sp. SM1919 TaxID=2662263 RepID=UPI0013D37FC8|nr:glutathione S-transferase family protein [Paraferrimonas sp. SM1919]
MQTQADIILYGVHLSYYSGKTRAHLKYKGVNFEEKRISKRALMEDILPVAGTPIIPVIKTQSGQLVQDTTEILDFIEQSYPKASVYPSTPKQKLAALLLEFYGDEWLLLPAMHYRWSHLDKHHDFIMKEFGVQVTRSEDPEEQIAAGIEHSKPFRNSIKWLGIQAETEDAIEQRYLQDLALLNQRFGKSDFLFGSRPSVADFGLMGPLYAHLGRDPYPKAIMQECAPHVYQWLQRMNKPQPLTGEFANNDDISPQVLQLLHHQALEQLPDVSSVIRANEAYMKLNPDNNIPRTLGFHPFTIGGVKSTRLISTYTQWMFQRSYDFYHSLGADDKQSCTELLAQVGALPYFQKPINARVKRQYGQLELVQDRG